MNTAIIYKLIYKQVFQYPTRLSHVFGRNNGTKFWTMYHTKPKWVNDKDTIIFLKPRSLGMRSLCIRNFKTSSRSFNKNQTDKSEGPDKEQQSVIGDFESALFRRLERAGFKRSRLFYWVVSILTTVVVGGAGYMYFFPHKIRQQVVEEVSTVASRSLEDENIAVKAEALSKDIINGILHDSQTKNVASDFVRDIIMSDQTKDAAIRTLLDLMNDPKVLELLRIRLSEIILDILQNDTTKQVVISQVNSILHHETIKLSLQNLLKDLVDTPEVQAMMAAFFKDVLASDTVKSQGKALGQQVTTDVISSREIQQQAGDALWSAIKFSIIPRVFSGKVVNGKPSDPKEKSEDSKQNTEKNSAKNSTNVKTESSENQFITIHTEGYDKMSRYDIDDDM